MESVSRIPLSHTVLSPVAVVLGAAAPLGQSVARHLARTHPSLLLVTGVDDDPAEVSRLRDDIRRARHLHGLAHDAAYARLALTDGTAVASHLREAAAMYGHLDLVVACGTMTVALEGGDGAPAAASAALADPFGAASFGIDIGAAAAALAGMQRPGDGVRTLVVATLVRGSWPGPLGPTAQQTALAQLGTFAQETAARVAGRRISVAGVALEDPSRGDVLLALDAGTRAVRDDRQRRATTLHDAARLVGFLGTEAARGLGGHGLFVGPRGTSAPVFRRSGGTSVPPMHFGRGAVARAEAV